MKLIRWNTCGSQIHDHLWNDGANAAMTETTTASPCPNDFSHDHSMRPHKLSIPPSASICNWFSVIPQILKQHAPSLSTRVPSFFLLTVTCKLYKRWCEKDSRVAETRQKRYQCRIQGIQCKPWAIVQFFNTCSQVWDHLWKHQSFKARDTVTPPVDLEHSMQSHKVWAPVTLLSSPCVAMSP